MTLQSTRAGAAFEAALDYLYSFIDFERKPQDRYMASKMDVSRPARFLEHFGAPQNQFPAIHIAGTKGKGSVAALCAFCLRAAGYRVGLYTSPHLVEFRERIRVLTPEDADGRIPPAAFVSLIEQMKPVIDAHFTEITWFEILTAAAFMHFAHAGVDVAVVEVGLGGRLDATNVLTPLVSVITSLSLDHTKLLGNTLAQIAYEKGGIIKPGVPVVIAPQAEEARQKLAQIAAARQAPLTEVGESWRFAPGNQDTLHGRQELRLTAVPANAFLTAPVTFDLSLSGDHQLENAAVALAALNVAQPALSRLDETAVRAGLAGVQWPGRLQIVHPGGPDSPILLVDCAHNPHSAAKLRHALAHDYDYNRLWLILGAPEDKDVRGMMQELLPLAAGLIVTTASHPRSMTPAALQQMAAEMGVTAVAAGDMPAAIAHAWALAQPGDLICVTGSIIVVGDLLNQWESLQSRYMTNGQKTYG